jgi:tetratricopeptide (TPR) repeat protein
MEQCSGDKLRAIEDCEKILQIIIPDGRYLEYHCNLAYLAYKKARICMKQKMYPEAIAALKEYREHSILADHADVHEDELRYTSMYLDLLVLPPNVPQERDTPSYRETYEIQIQDEIFDPIREWAVSEDCSENPYGS